MVGSFYSGGENGGWQPLPTKEFATAPMQLQRTTHHTQVNYMHDPELLCPRYTLVAYSWKLHKMVLVVTAHNTSHLAEPKHLEWEDRDLLYVDMHL